MPKPLDPAPYVDKADPTYRYTRTAIRAPYAKFSPRPEYEQDREKYPA